MVDFRERLARILPKREPSVLPQMITGPEQPLANVQGSPLQIAFSVISLDGCSVLMHSTGLCRPLRRRTGDPVQVLPEDWQVESVHQEFAPILIISLRHPRDGRMRWIIDVSGETYDEPVQQMPDLVRDALRAVVKRLLQDIRDRCVGALPYWNGLPRTIRLELLADLRRGATPAGSLAMDSLIETLNVVDDDAGDLLEVSVEDDVLSVLLPSGTEIPILMGRALIRHTSLDRGWTPDVLYRDLAPFFLLELRHERGARATWLLDQHLDFIGDVTTLSAAIKNELGLRAIPVINRHLTTVLAFAEPDGDPVVRRYLGLNGAARFTLVGHCAQSVRPSLRQLGLRQLPSVLPFIATSGDIPVVLRADAIERAVTVDVHRHTLDAILDGHLTWPSPVDGSAATLRGVFTLDDYVFFYQFVDRNGVEFLTIASDRSCRLIGVVVPAINVMLFDDRDANRVTPNQWMRGELGKEFWPLLVFHINQYSDEMMVRSRSFRAQGVNVLQAGWRVHICHHLWNDLSGLEALCAAVPVERLPSTMVIASADGRAELFGAVDALFPALRGHVDRSLRDVDAFIRWVYRNDVWPCRITRNYISAALRRRVVDHLAAGDELVQVRAQLAARTGAARAAPVVMFGLRVEDRTFADLPAFCEAFVAFIAEQHPGSVIVFDGYNARPGSVPGAVIEGMASGIARQPPHQVEMALIAGLVERFAASPVTVIGTTGQSIATSIAWCRDADAAFGIWGAGLTKYRWLANLPTMMITGHANLLGRPDILIYHDAAYMETPSPAMFVDASLIRDVGDIGLATGHIQGGRESFVADTEQVLLAFDRFLRQVLQDTASNKRVEQILARAMPG